MELVMLLKLMLKILSIFLTTNTCFGYQIHSKRKAVNEYIDKAIDEKIEFKKNQLTNPLTNSLVRFIDNVSNIAETQFKNFDGVDTNKLLNGISAMGEKFDMKEAVDMIVNTKYPANNKSAKKKPTRKTKAVKLDAKEAE